MRARTLSRTHSNPLELDLAIASVAPSSYDGAQRSIDVQVVVHHDEALLESRGVYRQRLHRVWMQETLIESLAQLVIDHRETSETRCCCDVDGDGDDDGGASDVSRSSLSAAASLALTPRRRRRRRRWIPTIPTR